MLGKRGKTIIFAILFVLLILAPVALNKYYNFLLNPVVKTGDDKIFVIRPGQAVASIGQNLEKEGLIRNAFAFRLLVAQMGIGQSIQAGDFRLSPTSSSREIAESLTHGAIDVWITIPEGFRIEEIADRVEAKLKFGSTEDYKFDKKEFIQSATEGYMFPDTYLIPRDATAGAVVNRLRTTFDEKIDKKILDEGRKNKLSGPEVVVLASLLEREAKTNEEKPVISGILINRLNAGIALQVDATVQYAKGKDTANNTWWPQVTTDDYKNVKSAYNTYLNVGLPPGPIANPGIESIRAAASPADTNYLYYLHDSKGKIHYAETGDEHNKNIEEHL